MLGANRERDCTFHSARYFDVMTSDFHRILMTITLIVSTGMGCSRTHALKTCDDATNDCCETNEQCYQYFGTEYPFCVDAHCAECTSDEHCLDDEICLSDDDVGRFCGVSDGQ